MIGDVIVVSISGKPYAVFGDMHLASLWLRRHGFTPVESNAYALYGEWVGRSKIRATISVVAANPFSYTTYAYNVSTGLRGRRDNEACCAI